MNRCSLLNTTTQKRSALVVLKGKLIDFDTNLPIESASVYVKENPTVGMATLSDGSFDLEVNATDTIIVSHLQYGTQEFKTNEVKPTIYLQEFTDTLDEIVIDVTPKPNYLKYAGYGLLALLVFASIKSSGNKKKLAAPKPKKKYNKPTPIKVEL